MGNRESGETESFETGLLEHPHYTRPQEWEGCAIPDILTSGNHGAIDKWRLEQAERITRERRPDLWEAYCKNRRKIGGRQKCPEEPGCDFDRYFGTHYQHYAALFKRHHWNEKLP